MSILGSIGQLFRWRLPCFWEISAAHLRLYLIAVVQAVVSRRQMSKLLPDDSPKTLAVACGLGRLLHRARMRRWLSLVPSSARSKIYGGDGI